MIHISKAHNNDLLCIKKTSIAILPRFVMILIFTSDKCFRGIRRFIVRDNGLEKSALSSTY